MTLKSNDAESSALITAGINYILIHIEKENSYFFIFVTSKSFLVFYNIAVLLDFKSNKCSLGEHKY